ncbi:hypothetical protein NE237_005808 [Protea cynaroides]|uniref:KIB1-4 beta-propeller domain-containing protein n=1 Tax=Protea cynaroides TaxID=273540 RepID=A0A9Q0KLE5_9MAGN|nr:hypothetical protein NE237_005808 [Protea cynaroides]
MKKNKFLPSMSHRFSANPLAFCFKNPLLYDENPVLRTRFSLQNRKRRRRRTFSATPSETVIIGGNTQLILLKVLSQNQARFFRLVFCKAGSNSWIHLDRTRNSMKYCEDIMYFNGLLLILDAHGSIEAWNVHDFSLRKPTEFAPPLKGFSLELPRPHENWFIMKRYLEKAAGDLLQVLF